jgi:DNA polymerase III subunit delta'
VSSLKFVDEKILKQLKRQVQSGTHATTYLFTGNEEEKKKALAVAFAKVLNCMEMESPSLRGRHKSDVEAISRSERVSPRGRETRDTSTGCECESCMKIEHGNHPDIKWLGEDEEVNSIKISEVREFKGILALKPYEGKMKVFIFNQADRLSADAQNALLKSLEEPPPYNVIILLASHRRSLFNTIVSRSLEIKVPPFTKVQIEKMLESHGVGHEEARFLVRDSNGAYHAALSAHEEGWFQEKNEWLDGLFNDLTQFFGQFQSVKRNELLTLFSFLKGLARDLIVFRASGDENFLIHVDRVELIRKRSAAHEWNDITEVLETMNELEKSVRSFGNQKLALTRALVTWSHFLAVK